MGEEEWIKRLEVMAERLEAVVGEIRRLQVEISATLARRKAKEVK